MPPDLEPASSLALATRIYGLLDVRATYDGDQFIAEAARLIHEDRAAVREPLETQLDELRRRLHEQADVIAERDRRIAELQARIYELEGQLANTHDVLVNLRGERNDLKAEAFKAEQRIASSEAQLASARDEVLREAVAVFRGMPEEWPEVSRLALSSGVARIEKLLPPPAAQKEHAAQSAMASAVESKLALYTTTEPEKEPHAR